jgi:hypothetical protein
MGVKGIAFKLSPPVTRVVDRLYQYWFLVSIELSHCRLV